ncbi:septum formation initiator family protein [Halioxenophilus sp. WMMB6]|uniref:septum formation initiator family protein n=1 Tax=Halioxenophilus sp. WMMB6 TaxID=3073815 RepID=UPI00295F40F0|nr:septum formation initiator family protein [Halioxenophilus sp. WMMB6]
MKWIVTTLVILLAGLQLRLWVGEGSLADIARLKSEIEQQERFNARDRERNRMLQVEISHLKNGLAGVEELAREDMGMVKQGETFYLVVDRNNRK